MYQPSPFGWIELSRLVPESEQTRNVADLIAEVIRDRVITWLDEEEGFEQGPASTVAYLQYVVAQIVPEVLEEYAS